MQYIAFDSHKKYTFVSVEKEGGGIVKEGRIDHTPGVIKQFLSTCEPGSPVAVETIGNECGFLGYKYDLGVATFHFKLKPLSTPFPHKVVAVLVGYEKANIPPYPHSA